MTLIISTFSISEAPEHIKLCRKIYSQALPWQLASHFKTHLFHLAYNNINDVLYCHGLWLYNHLMTEEKCAYYYSNYYYYYYDHHCHYQMIQPAALQYNVMPCTMYSCCGQHHITYKGYNKLSRLTVAPVISGAPYLLALYMAMTMQDQPQDC